MYRSQLTHFGVPPLILSLYGVISERKCEEEEEKNYFIGRRSRPIRLCVTNVFSCARFFCLTKTKMYSTGI